MDRHGILGSSDFGQAGSFCAACRSDFVDGLVGIEARGTVIAGRAQGSWLSAPGSSTSCLLVTEDDRHMAPWEDPRMVTGVRSERNLGADKVGHRGVHLEACWRMGSRVHGWG